MITLSSLACSEFLGARIPTPFSPPPCALRSFPPCVALHAPATAATMATLYDVLGIAAGAAAGEVKAAYRRLARECHPDVVAADRKGTSADEFMRIHAAYATLSDPEKRADYDRRLAAAAAATMAIGRQQWSPRGPRPFSSSSSGPSAATSFSGFRRRTWETDQCW